MLDLEEEKKLFNQGYCLVGGIDEAGRGPLAGPVVAACVIIDKNFEKLESGDSELRAGVRDSKKLTHNKREELFDIIYKEFEMIGVGICDNEIVDRINILQATFLAMKKAIGDLGQKPDFVMIDGKFPMPNTSLKQQPIIKGDDRIFSIATASIVAKVTRDRIMQKFHEEYPQYGFDKHKGYGTKMHREAIAKYGPCPIHRKSFKGVKEFV